MVVLILLVLIVLDIVALAKTKYILSRRAVASPPWMCCTRSSWGQSSPLDDAASNELRWTGGITGPAQKR